MENQVRDTDLIQRYLEKNLAQAELHELEYRLQEETSLQVLLREQRELMLGIRFGHLQQKLEELRALDAVIPSETNERSLKVRSQWPIVAMAAMVVITIGVWFFAFRDSRPLHERLFADTFEAFDSPGSGLTRSEEGNHETARARAYEAYDNGNYPKAIKLFETALREKDDPILHLCLGNAYLATGDYSHAEKIFRHMLTDHQDLVTQAKWYLALTYLKMGNIERTKSTLWEISKSSTYGDKARKLLRDLD